MKAALLRNTLALALLVYALADWHVWCGPFRQLVESLAKHEPIIEEPAIARVGMLKVTSGEMREALREHLWRHGRTWNDLSPQEEGEVRAEVLQNLIDERLVTSARARGGEASSVAVERELSELRRQFDQDKDFDQRLELHQMNEVQLRLAVNDAIADQNWIDGQVTSRMKLVTDAEVADWIQRHSSALTIPAIFSVAHIYLTTHDEKKPDREPEIREIYRRLKTGEATFEKLAAECSEDDRTKAAGGYLGWLARCRMPEDFMTAVERMTKGQVSEPVRTELGWHIIQLVDSKPARDAAVDEVKTEVAALLTNERRAQAVKTLLSELRTKSQAQLRIDQSRLDVSEPAGVQ